ncbi:hypothetical protein BpHYR1_037279 [Brachionus plicatilis]|uniref:Uncharacterized protein n=1 Tax=Brachionus plicatilis TaxID=10195 RepID=A0A3M7QKV0_BRAPC|nr:hypothetical protein BpHYR1_037279 [Brachionus plicatilis]
MKAYNTNSTSIRLIPDEFGPQKNGRIFSRFQEITVQTAIDAAKNFFGREQDRLDGRSKKKIHFKNCRFFGRPFILDRLFWRSKN